jgi:co-chaperonin GroES (HSP10)
VLEEPQRLDLSLEPLDDFVVVQPADEETETRTGLIIPASDDAGCRTGIVTATGAAVKLLRRSELIARVND